MLVHNAQTIIGPDRLVADELFNDMRERWLKFGETTSLALQQNQADLLNTLIMAFLEPEYQVAAAEEGLATSLDTGTFTEHSFDGPLWSEYKRLCEEAKNALWNVARHPTPPCLCRAIWYNNTMDELKIHIPRSRIKTSNVTLYTKKNNGYHLLKIDCCWLRVHKYCARMIRRMEDDGA